MSKEEASCGGWSLIKRGVARSADLRMLDTWRLYSKPTLTCAMNSNKFFIMLTSAWIQEQHIIFSVGLNDNGTGHPYLRTRDTTNGSTPRPMSV